jgi:hypothetical protein
VSARTEFFSAVVTGDEAKARAIFADGKLDANVRDRLIGGTPALSLAAHSGMTDLTRDLLNQGANPNLYDGAMAPIHHAGSREMVAMLVKAGADINAPTLSEMDDVGLVRKGATRLHMAVTANDLELVAGLLEQKANPMAVDAAYRIPEQYAVGKPELLDVLQQARAGLSPVAHAAGHEEPQQVAAAVAAPSASPSSPDVPAVAVTSAVSRSEPVELAASVSVPDVSLPTPAATAVEVAAAEKPVVQVDGDDVADRVNALLAGLDPDMIDGGDHVSQYLGMSDETTNGASKPAESARAQKGPAPEVNTIEVSNEGRAADPQSSAPAATKEAGKEDPEAKDSDNDRKVKPLPIFGKDGYEIPKSVKVHYVAVDGKFVDRKTEQIGFEDTGRKLSTKSEDRKVIENMIAVAEAKNWGTLHIQGTEDFRRQAWMAAEVAGLDSTGYKPTAQDRAAVQARREEMRIAAGEKPAEQSRENTIESKGSKAQDLSPAPGEKGQPVASSTVPAPVVQEAPSRAPQPDIPSSVPDVLPTDVKGAPLPAEVAEKILAHREEMRIRDAREQFFKRGQEIASKRGVGLDAAAERRNEAVAPSVQQEPGRDAAARPDASDDRQNERSNAPGTAGAQQASSREAAARLVLETEMSNLGLPEADRQAMRDNLNAAISDARDKGVEIDVPEPMVVERGVSTEPSKAVEIAQKQTSPVQEVER